MTLSHNLVRRTLLILGLPALAAGAAGFGTSPALPQATGTRKVQGVTVQGVTAPVVIVRDRAGVPHIRAGSENDALFGLGYAHAQDRLWQMEYQRRLGSGRLAEVLGESALPSDRFFRTLGLHRASARAWANFPPDERRAVESYVAGVNAFLKTCRPDRLPVEYRILNFRPEPWRPEDTLVWTKTLSWGQGGNWEAELMRAQLAQKLGPERAAQLLPAFMAKDPIILPDAAGRTASRGPRTAEAGFPHPLPPYQTDELLALGRTLRERFGVGGEQAGSNNWVIGGARTTTGKPLLANDPHLPSQIPSTWYLARIEGGALDVIGATLPGVPAVIAGHNGHVAWGITNTSADVQDLFIEQIHGTVVEYGSGVLEPLKVVPETIKVKGQSDVTLSVRITRHGPIISDVVAPGGAALALRWTGLDARDDTVAALLRMNRARNRREFVGSLRAYKVAMQSTVYADADGNIGYIAPGAIPLRAKGDGTMPVPGWTGEYEWTGYVPFEELPQMLNPPQGYIATANNRIANDDYPHHISSTFAPPYRALRIKEVIESRKRHSADSAAALQADVLSVHAREALPYLLHATPVDERSRVALHLLRGWDGTMRGDSPQAAILQAWLARIPAALFADELGEALFTSYRGLRYMSDAAMANALNDPASPWWDDARTPAMEDSRTILGAALAEGLAAMAAIQGTDDLRRWRWDRVHHAVFPHQPFDKDPRLQPRFNRGIPNGGDRFTVNVGPPGNDTFEQRHVAGYRQIVDFGDLDGSRFIVAPGQSGDVRSRHYDDLLSVWQRVKYLPMR